MRSSVLFDTLQNLIEYKPSQKAIGDIIGVKQNSIAGRVARDATMMQWYVKFFTVMDGGSVRLQ